METYLETYTGRQINLNHPDPSSIDILDIAHALSLQCRYGGHCSRFCSVGEHSVLVARALCDGPIETRRWGLMHDSTEAYLCDLPRPIKLILLGYREMEDALALVIQRRFSFDMNMVDRCAVKHADNAVLMAEAKVLMPSQGKGWCIEEPPAECEIEGWSPQEAEYQFLVMAAQLGIISTEEFLRARDNNRG